MTDSQGDYVAYKGSHFLDITNGITTQTVIQDISSTEIVRLNPQSPQWQWSLY